MKEAISHAKARAEEKQVPFELDSIECPDVCPVLGTPLIYARRGLRAAFDDSPSIDRIVPELGYVEGNVCVISHRANRIKSDATVKELERVLEYVRAATGGLECV